MTDFDAAVLDHHRARDDDVAPYICGHLLRDATADADWYWLPPDPDQHAPAGFYCRACCARHLADGAPRRADDPAIDYRQETAA